MGSARIDNKGCYYSNNGYYKETDKRSVYSFIFADINSNNRLEKSNVFKLEFCYEKCLDVLFPKARNILAKFRCSAHNLMVEQGRFINVGRCNRICQFCNMNCIEDEYHFLLVCPVYRDLRHKYLKSIIIHGLQSIDLSCC